MIIYKATNTFNGKVYIGQTSMTLKRRIDAHYQHAKSGSETNFHRALRKYSPSIFIWETLELCKTADHMNEREVFYIKEYNSFKTGYNMTEGGDGGLTYKKGTPLYERIRHKLGKWKNGNPGASKEAIEKRINSFVNVQWTKGKQHKNSGHSHNKGKVGGSRNGMFGKTPHLVSVEVDGIQYDSLGLASKALVVSRATVRNRCNSDKYPTWRIIGVTKQTKF